MSYSAYLAIRECVSTTTDEHYCAEYAEKELARVSSAMSAADIHGEVGYYKNRHGKAPRFTVKDEALMRRWQPSIDLYGQWEG